MPLQLAYCRRLFGRPVRMPAAGRRERGSTPSVPEGSLSRVNSAQVAATLRRGAGFFPLFAALVLAACGGPPAAPPAPPPVEVGVVDVAAARVAAAARVCGAAQGVREVEVRARVSGILLERRYKEGARVKAGDLLFRIDPAPFRAEVARARAERRRAAGEPAAGAPRARSHRAAVRPEAREPARSRQRASRRSRAPRRRSRPRRRRCARAELDLSYTDVRAPIAGSRAARCAPKAASSRRAAIRAC